MRDALGGTVTLVIIVVFIVIALGYMAFNVNYTKACRMKDKIITLYDDFDGQCPSKCENAIRDYARTIGYSTDYSLHCPDDFSSVNELYCISKKEYLDQDNSRGNSSITQITGKSDIKPKVYYKIVTKINLKIPIISNVFDFRFFYIYGNTKSFEKHESP
jgi:hypothetical protein